MQPFHELVKTNSKFMWKDTLTQILENSKQILILANKVKEGIQLFDVTRKTYLQTDWSKESIGYLLQYCNCPTSQAPTCCPDGWKLIFSVMIHQWLWE